jgi:hypothetical protein
VLLNIYGGWGGGKYGVNSEHILIMLHFDYVTFKLHFDYVTFKLHFDYVTF